MEKADFLDAIIDSILNSDPEAPKFVRDCEKKVVNEVHAYTDRIRLEGAEKLAAREETVAFIEENAERLLDSVCVSNRIYMKTGMKLGAKLVFQLMGL